MKDELNDLLGYQDKSPNAKDPLSEVVLDEKVFKELKETVYNIIYNKKPINKIVDIKLSPMAEKYKKAWKKVYNKQAEWRRKEIDKQMESGKLSDKSYDTDFAQQVASLAEKL